MLKKIVLGIGALTLVVFGIAGLQSPDYTVSRSIIIHAPAEKIFPHLNNQKLAEQWGPWASMDPDSKMTYSGPEDGIGAKVRWTGGKKMGTGSATIVNVIANERVDIRIEYTEPMGMVQDSEYLITPEGENSKVSWTVRGKNSLVGRVMCLFTSIDKMVGPMFEKGLSNLKILIENNG